MWSRDTYGKLVVFPSLIMSILIVLKLGGLIAWSWAAVTSPIWALYGTMILTAITIVLTVGCFYLLCMLLHKITGLNAWEYLISEDNKDQEKNDVDSDKTIFVQEFADESERKVTDSRTNVSELDR